jgi:hypothetical protein
MLPETYGVDIGMPTSLPSLVEGCVDLIVQQNRRRVLVLLRPVQVRRKWRRALRPGSQSMATLPGTWRFRRKIAPRGQCMINETEVVVDGDERGYPVWIMTSKHARFLPPQPATERERYLR